MTSLQDSDKVGESSDRAPRHGLAKKLAAIAFVSAFVTSLAVTWAAIDSSQQSLNKIVHQQIPASLRRVAQQQMRWIRSGERQLAAFGSNLTKPGAPLEMQSFQPLLARWIENSAHFHGIAVVGGGGKTLAARGRFDGEAFAAAAPGRGTPRLRASADSNRQFASTPLPSSFPSGSLLVAEFLPFTLDHALDEESPLLGATITVYDPNGSFAVTASDARASFRPEPDALARAPVGPSGHTREYRNASDEHVIGSAIPFDLFGWQIAIEVPFDVAFEPVLSAAARMLAIEFCIVLTFSFVAYRITTVMLRPIEELSAGAQLIAAGAIDHEIAETGSDDEVGLLARSFNQMMRTLRRDHREIEEAHRELVEKNHDLQRANEILNQLSITDGLTKLHNHRFFQDHLTREIKRVNRLDEPLAIILLDVDDFKSLNDRFGHASGDEVLMRLARIMESSVRETDLLARYGGEEFVIVASNTDSLGAYQLAEKIRLNVEDAEFRVGETLRSMHVTVSIGVAQFEGNRRKFFVAADRALYNAKAEGKNCVVVDDGTG